MSDEVKGFIIYRKFHLGISLLSREQKGLLLEALFADMGEGEMPDLDPVTQAIFSMMLPSVHEAQTSFSRRAEASRENGRLGGRPSKTMKDNKFSDGLSENLQVSEKPSEKPRNLENLQVSENLNRIDKNRIDINTPLTPQGELVQVKPARVKAEYPADFEEFWKRYPRKNGKDAALRAWKAKKREGRLPALSVLAEAIDAAKRSDQWQRDGGQYIPHPATWLNQGRWMDEQAQEEPVFRIPDWARSENR